MEKKKLEAKMKLYGDTQESLANYLNISTTRLNAKINRTNGADFRQKEILKLKERYKLSAEEVNEIFFSIKVS